MSNGINMSQILFSDFWNWLYTPEIQFHFEKKEHLVAFAYSLDCRKSFHEFKMLTALFLGLFIGVLMKH